MSSWQLRGTKAVPHTTKSARGLDSGRHLIQIQKIQNGKQEASNKVPQHFNFVNVSSDIVNDEEDDIDENEENIDHQRLNQINPQISEVKNKIQRTTYQNGPVKFKNKGKKSGSFIEPTKSKQIQMRLSFMDKISEKNDDQSAVVDVTAVQ